MKFNYLKALFVGALMFVTSIGASAQMDASLPRDGEVRIGQLDNGLTYYIRHNEKPKGQADFYIAQKVGSILENDDQRGLAHFLEHMCFNGTKNFPGNSLIDWLESIGVKFGQNLNAYTSIDQTVYNISNVPVARESVQDSVLLILHDWADDLLLTDEEIDKERGVIHQEWRRSNVGQMRIIENLLPVIYPDNKYGLRLPIGTMEVVDNFPYQVLRDYYEAWYRPDQQGIIVVGDIDVDRIENKIKELFSPIKMPENAPVREYLEVADNDDTIYAVGADKEMTNTIVEIMFKTDAMPFDQRNTLNYVVMQYMVNMIDQMINARFSEMIAKGDTPLAQAFGDYGEFFVSKTKDAFTVGGVAKEDDMLAVLETVYREALRAARGGFTVSEYQRASDEYMSRIERAYNNRNDRYNEQLVQDCVNNFLTNEPMMALDQEYQLMQMIVPNLNVEAINMILPQIITGKNMVVLGMMPEKEGLTLPTVEQMAAVMAKVEAEEIEPFKDEMKAEPLIEALPAPGKIVAQTENKQWDATEFTLSNGVKVIVKPTTFRADEILFMARAKVGTANLSDDLTKELLFLDDTLDGAGLGTYTNTDLQKYLQGKQAHVSGSVNSYMSSVQGSTTPKDLPTMMELIYKTFTDVTITEDEYAALQTRSAAQIKNQENNPQFIFMRDLMKSLYTTPRHQVVTPDDIMGADRETILKIVKDVTANAADYTFIFVGNVDIETLKPLLEQYIATLPADPDNLSPEITVNHSLDMKSGKGTDTFTTAMDTPQTWVYIGSQATVPYTAKNVAAASAIGQILSKRLLETVREDMGAVYSIGAHVYMSRMADNNLGMQSAFPMKPEMKQEVLDFIEAEINRMQSDIKPEELNKVIEYGVKTAIEDKESNSAWLEAIAGTLYNGVDTFNDSVNAWQSLTIDDVQNLLKEMLAQGTYRVVVLDPAE